MKAYLLVLIILIANVSFAQWTNNQNAEYVIGQPDFTTYTNGSTTQQFYNPSQCAIDYVNNKLYVADFGNFRVLRFSYPITSSNPTAEMYFGTGSFGTSQSIIGNPSGVAVYNGTLWVCDMSNSRILKFNDAYLASNSPNADGILGHTSYTDYTSGTSQSMLNQPGNIFIDDGGNLWVADGGNYRVLKFNNVISKSNGANADLVLGHPDFTSNDYSTTQSTFRGASSVCVLGTTVWVVDSNNHRVLRFDNPTTNGVNANGVLGQTDFTSGSPSATSPSGFYYPNGSTIDNTGRLYLVDGSNHRVLIFNDAANKSNGGSADNVLGQSSFYLSSANKGQNGFNFPSAVVVDPINNKLFVSDRNDNRVLQFAASSALPVELTSFTANNVDQNVELKWTTATEVNNYGFEILRKYTPQNESSYAADFSGEESKIGFVQGNGNSNSPKSYMFLDNNPPSGSVQYRLKQIDFDGKYKYSDIVEVTIEAPANFALEQNYPNPFNPTTSIKYQLSSISNVSLKVYDVIGREIATLVNEQKAPGNYEVKFDGNKYASGIYFYRLQSGSFVKTKKLLLLK